MKKLLAVFAGVAALGALAWLLVSTPQAHRRVYHGKTLHTWLLQLSASDPKARQEAEEAFRGLGTNAVPELVRLLATEDARWRTWIWSRSARLPKRARWLLQTHVDPPMRHVVRPAAAQALGKLGPAAAPAMPALIGMLETGNPYEQGIAGQSLGQIGAPALAALAEVAARDEGAAGNAAANALLRHYRWPRRGEPASENAIADQTTTERQRAVDVLGASGRTNEVITSVLARAALDPAPGVRLAALQALVRANRDLKPALPQISACSRDESPAIRLWAAKALGKADPAPRLAVSALTRLAQDKDESVRAAAQAELALIQSGSRITNHAAPPR